MPVEQGLYSRLVRPFGFVKKELASFARQPRLILTLVIAPFAILLVFGLGYRTQPPPFETLLVLPNEDARLATQTEDLSEAFGDAVELVGISTDAADARTRLRRGEIDLLIIGPSDALTSLDEGENARFVIVHSEVDPVIRASISLLARLSVEELNQRILERVVSGAQTESEDIEDPLAVMRSGAEALVSALERGDSGAAERERVELADELASLEAGATSSNSLYSSVAEALGTNDGDVFGDLGAQLEATDSVQQQDALQSARELHESLSTFEDQLRRAQEVDPALLVSPFATDVQDIADLPATPSFFYAPGAIMVLIQHLAVTFGSLSLVRERQFGLIEIFRVSPLTPVEILIGKYVAFVSIAVSIAALLVGAMIAVGVSMRGSLSYLALTMLLVIIAALGMGFVISGLATTDSQAVQFSMMVLLMSIFFTGLILPLSQLIPSVRALSYLLPATYGIASLHDVMFRGLNPQPVIIWGLAGYSLLAAIGSWWSVKRQMTGVSV